MEGQHPLGIRDKHWNKLSDEQKELAYAKEASKKKIEALKAHILEECGKQDFTVGEVGQLIGGLSASLSNRRGRIEYEPFNYGNAAYRKEFSGQTTDIKAIANLLLQRERILAMRKQQSQQCTQTDSPS